MKRFIWLDALRGVASIAVLIFHYHHFYLIDFSTREQIPSSEFFPYSNFLGFFYDYGKYSVQLFWVISGFVFFHIYINRETSFFKFFVHRFARLYPLHLATLLCVAFLQIISLKINGHWQIYGNNDLFHFVLQLFFASNSLTVSHGLSFNGPIWSVSLEVFTYFVFFLSLRLLTKSPLLTSSVVFITFFFLGFYINYDLWILSELVFVCSSYFFCGGITYLIYNFANGSLVKFILAFSLFLIGIFIGFFYQVDFIKIMLISALMVFLVSFLDARFPMQIKFIDSLGNSSYSLYLIHIPIQIVVLTFVDAFCDGTRTFANDWITLPAYLIVSLLTAHYIFVLYEKPAGKWLRNRLL